MVRSDTVSAIGKNLEFEIQKSKKTIPLLAKMMDLDARTIYKSVKSERVSPSVIEKYSNHFQLPFSFFTKEMSDTVLNCKIIKDWNVFCSNCYFDHSFNYELDFKKMTKNDHNKFDILSRQFLEKINDIVGINLFPEKNHLFSKLDNLKSSYDIAAIAEKLEQINVRIFYGRYLFWELDTTSEIDGRHTYDSTRKFTIIFSDKNSEELVLMNNEIGEIPPNPYEIFKDNPNHIDLIISGRLYNFNQYKKFFTKTTFDLQREELNDEYCDDAIELVQEALADVLPDIGGDDINSYSPDYSQVYKKFNDLMKQRDAELREIEAREMVFEDQSLENNDK